ncbi:RagB/SusD family nutrient uptake outer membrane protein [Sphingobacterium sp. SRCM116780]|uniref:RagB/SusD family nutrient uptake outer membrane protein n=1 Tax=Sphingobacterium sp. SRCM116780 TaxID=2907623 RepID=UPI001F2E23D2|nr:RagB/SusD family nutrient uptake outer membrane protein [Sphingobacterium sp. SRCM116780]UIR57939.1 RagB/SusD family nutrient uptake outer membrane protein [Sphingobacterium sp. SRCM116780]
MNTIKNVFYISAFALFFSSCELNEVPKASATEDDIFGTESGLKTYSYSFYNNITSGSDAYKGDAMSDYAAVNSLNDFMVKGAFSAETSSGWSWSTLRNINQFIVKNNNPNLADNVKNNYNGIARFFRAWFYYDMLVRFGDLPWVDHPISQDEKELLYATQDSREVVVKHILEDLDFAFQNINETGGDGTMINKWTALGLKTRVALFEGTYRKYHNINLETKPDQFFQMVVDAGKILMEQSPYGLNTAQGVQASQRQLFISNTAVTKEVMLAVAFSKEQAVLNDANWWYTSATYGPRMSLTRQFINTILNIDGTPYTDRANFQTQEFFEECQNRDYRLAQLIRTPGYMRNAVATTANFSSHTYTGYQPIKYTLDDPYYDNGAYNTNAVPLMRFAEVLLNVAEAKAELNQMNATDWQKTIGAIRARSGVTGGINELPTKVDNYLKQTFFPNISDPILLEVRRERQIELALEGFRFTDLKRWKLGTLMATLPWTGIYVPALDKLMDLDHNGTSDVVFYDGNKSAPSITVPAGVAKVAVGGKATNFQTMTSDNHLEWFKAQPRDWDATDRQYLYPIPAAVLVRNNNLKQNPNW